jgi:hypothetical protein
LAITNQINIFLLDKYLQLHAFSFNRIVII